MKKQREKNACDAGLSCGTTCISSQMTCRIALGKEANKALAAAIGLIEHNPKAFYFGQSDS